MVIHNLPQRHTQAGQLLELIAISGDFPVDLLSRLPGGTSYKESVVKVLKRKGFLRSFYRDSLRTLRLTAGAKSMLLSRMPERFSFYLTGNADTNLLKGEITRRLRLYQIAVVYINMKQAGVHIYRDDKPKVFSTAVSPVPLIGEPVFYSSREVKEMGMEATKIRGSRMAGVLLAASGIYTVYNSCRSLTKWEVRSELRVKALLQIELCQRRLSGQYAMEQVSALLFGDRMELAEQILTGGRTGRESYFILDGNYEHFYFFTNDRFGEVLLKLLCSPEQTAELNQILSQGLTSRELGWHIENDAIDSAGEPILFGYFFDMPRIARFCTGLELQQKNGTLICFDFQKEALLRCCGSRVRFQTIDFEKFERRFFP